MFAQQSIREMGRCHRTPRDVLDDATWGAFQAGWTEPVGGDADHLEELEDIDATASAGFVFYTLDPKAEVDPEAEHADPATIRQKVEALDWAGLESDLAGVHQDATRASGSTSSTRRSSWTRSPCCGRWPSTAPPWPTRWPCTGG